jgi:hypothetical protein
MKKRIKIFIVICLTLFVRPTFSQNRYWVIPPSYVDFYTGQVLSLPNTAVSPATTVSFTDLVNGGIGTLSGTPLNKGTDYIYSNSKSSNGILNSSGSLSFYLNNGAFAAPGRTILYSGQYLDDLPIIPVPGNCNHYFLVSGITYTSPNSVINYKEITLDGNTIDSRSLTIPNHLFQVAALTGMKINPTTNLPESKLYMLGFDDITEIAVSQTGLTFSRSFHTTHYMGVGSWLYTELEISPNGRYLAWCDVDQSSDLLNVFDLQTSMRYKYHSPTGEDYCRRPIGLEFSSASDRVYFDYANAKNYTCSAINRIGYFNLSAGVRSAVSSILTNVQLNTNDISYINNTTALGNSFIELAVDGLMYVSNGNNFQGFDPSNPQKGIIKTITMFNPVVSLPSHGDRNRAPYDYYNLPDQIDGTDHTHLFKIGCDLTKTYSNVTSADGSLPAITTVSRILTAQTNVSISANTSVTFKAGEQIFLKPGFTVSLNGNFNGKLQYCDDLVTSYCPNEGRLVQESIKDGSTERIVNIYPNPNNGQFNIKANFAEINDHVKVEVISLSGVTIRSKHYDQIQLLDDMLDISDAAQGVYVVKFVLKNGKVVNKKIVKL